MQKLPVWTKAYRPFMLGGNVNAPIATEVEVGEATELAPGISVHVVVSPTGTAHVAEATTGAFVGTDIEQVRKDVQDADPEIIKDQLKKAKAELDGVDHLDPAVFWGLFKNE